MKTKTFFMPSKKELRQELAKMIYAVCDGIALVLSGIVATAAIGLLVFCLTIIAEHYGWLPL